MSSQHRPTFVALVQQHGWTRGVELGVDKGILFRMLLEGCPDLHLTGVDLFPDAERSRRVLPAAGLYADRARVLEMSTTDAAAEIEDASLDFVFIDADHSHDAVMADIAAWQPKVKPGGWIGGHDYHPRKFPGVVKAVRKVFDAPELYPGTIWGVWQ